MKTKIELLAPAGDIDSIKAAIIAGADAIYCGLNKFNARNRAANIIFEDLTRILKLAHKNNCKIFLTLNIIILENEISAIINLLNKLINTDIDGIIVQDLGLFYLLSKYFKNLKIHASTQFTTHNEGQINFLNKLNVNRVNLSRELSITEINGLTVFAKKSNILTEVFVHGSYCLSFSGICYISSVHGGNSGNRGRCSQPCREKYLTTPEGKNFPLNLKDNSAYSNLQELIDAGVASLKIEGRMKKFHYVYTVINFWKNQIHRFYSKKKLNTDNRDLYKVFNRGFSNAYLLGEINKDMFIDNPRDNSIKHLSDIINKSANKNIEKEQIKLYEEKEKLIINIKNKISQLNISKSPLIIKISGKLNTPLEVSVETPDNFFTILSEVNLVHSSKYNLDYNTIIKRLKTLNNSEYYIKDLELNNIQPGLFVSFKELTSIKNRIVSHLNGSKKIIAPIILPFLDKKPKLIPNPSLSVLISSKNDLHICDNTSADIIYQLPNGFKNEYTDFINLFLENKNLIPLFPSILIGENFKAATKFLKKIQPGLIITNNTGIAYEAYKQGIPWIAGPYLNIINSYSLLCIKEKFNCYGSFISNEINKNQIKMIVSPENFKLYYSIYHPILLLPSRQCLFHQITGCDKEYTNDCLGECERTSAITNLNDISFLIDKQKGNYHEIYNFTNYLNTHITDIPDVFSNFFIDLRNIKSKTKIELDKVKIIKLFETLISGNFNSKNTIEKFIHPTTNSQYKKGI